tara:strand:+ start:426 stop:929 length:504 start_codon:yes stop_codon:yes gene_type:complete
MIEKIERYYLEINSIKNLNIKTSPSNNLTLKETSKNVFDLNKFFYKQIGKNHQWVDRLTWQDKNWIDYVSNQNLKTFVLLMNNEYIGYFELIFDKTDCEIAYFGVLEEFIGKGYGGFLLSKALTIAFQKANRVWVHTCSLDHPNAIKNYKSRGMKIFKTEILKRKAI